MSLCFLSSTLFSVTWYTWDTDHKLMWNSFCRANIINPSWMALHESRGTQSPNHKLFMRSTGKIQGSLILCMSYFLKILCLTFMLSFINLDVLLFVFPVLVADVLIFFSAIFLYFKTLKQIDTRTKVSCAWEICVNDSIFAVLIFLIHYRNCFYVFVNCRF